MITARRVRGRPRAVQLWVTSWCSGALREHAPTSRQSKHPHSCVHLSCALPAPAAATPAAVQPLSVQAARTRLRRCTSLVARSNRLMARSNRPPACCSHEGALVQPRWRSAPCPPCSRTCGQEDSKQQGGGGGNSRCSHQHACDAAPAHTQHITVQAGTTQQPRHDAGLTPPHTSVPAAPAASHRLAAPLRVFH